MEVSHGATDKGLWAKFALLFAKDNDAESKGDDGEDFRVGHSGIGSTAGNQKAIPEGFIDVGNVAVASWQDFTDDCRLTTDDSLLSVCSHRG